MEVKHLKNVGNHVGKDSEAATKGGDDKLRKEFTLGDIVWIKIYDSSWWPAQVVDENTIGGGEKIEKKMEGGVLTRLYGSYEYLYVDPMKYHSEFENVLKQNNCSVKEILNKALEQDLSRIKSGAKSKRKASTRKGKLQDGLKSNLLEAKARDESCKDKISVQDGVKKKKKADGQDSDMHAGRKRKQRDPSAENGASVASKAGRPGSDVLLSVRVKKRNLSKESTPGWGTEVHHRSCCGQSLENPKTRGYERQKNNQQPNL